jgi:hypothetical protein
MGLGTLRMSTELLLDMLRLNGYTIKGARFDWPNVVELLLESDDIPENPCLAQVFPHYKQVEVSPGYELIEVKVT